MIPREEFKKIAGFDLVARQTNRLSDKIERKDALFNFLSGFYFSHPQKFEILKGKVREWIKEEKNEEMFALAGYVYYISENYKQAKQFFLKNISLNPDNLDNWLDLAFCLRHNGEYEISSAILFHYRYAIYYFKYLSLKGCSYPKLKKMLLEIVKHADAA